MYTAIILTNAVLLFLRNKQHLITKASQPKTQYKKQPNNKQQTTAKKQGMPKTEAAGFSDIKCPPVRAHAV